MSAGKKTILIAGGSGLIGSFLSRSLAAEGHEIRLLSRDPDEKNKFSTYAWDIEEEYVDPFALKEIDVIINLAGASLASHRWTKERKRILASSRIGGNQLLFKALYESGERIDQFIGASAIGFYGDRGDKLLDEESLQGRGYMSQLCSRWENSHWRFEEVAEQVAAVRIGLVLSNEGGVLPTLRNSIIGGIGTVLGSGQQFMSWIHIEDLIQIFVNVIENPTLNGAVNGVAPHPVRHRSLMQQLIERKGGLNWMLPIPEFLLRLVMGEMSHMVLDSTRVQPKKMQLHGFDFKYKDLVAALDNLDST